MNSSPGAGAPARPTRRSSLSRKLPLLISGLLAAAILIFSFVAYRQLTRALVGAASVRMSAASHLLAGLFDDSGRRLRAEADSIAKDPAVIRTLRSSDAASVAAAQSALTSWAARSGQTWAIGLRNANGDRVLWAEGKGKASAAFLRDRPLAARKREISTLQQEHGVLFYTVGSPVLSGAANPVGFITVYKQIASGQSAQLIGRLIGSEASIAVGNPDGKLWTDLSKVVPGPVMTGKPGLPRLITTSSGEKRIGAAVATRGTPWLVWVDIPVTSVLAPARTFLRDMMVAAVLLLLVGGLAALMLSRQITRPLAAITDAAQGIASGDYSRRVNISRGDELGVLADSFNSMAAQVDESRNELEKRVRERTRDLQSALGELHDAQESLVRREKLAMLGQLAGGVGHELRNPLGVMTNAIYYLKMVLKDAPENVREYLGILRTQIALSEKIVGDLLDFARVKRPQVETVSVSRIVNEQLEKIGKLENITVKRELPENLPLVRVDRVQIGQVVLNLLTNAAQAMEGKGGVLTIRARRSDDTISLEVSDTGTGMKPDDLRKIFEPLFTTKARGIGLGLAVSQSLAQANGGEISAQSEVGKGSTMSVRLPTVRAEAA